jgi:hypothetical protein
MGIKDAYEDAKKPQSENVKELATAFNSLAAKLIKKGLEDANAGRLEIRDSTDLVQLIKSFKDLNNLTDGIGDIQENGSLPQLNAGQEHLIEARLKITDVKKTDSDGNVVDTPKIKLDDLAKMSKEDTSKLIKEREKQVNNDNAKEIL